MINGAVNRKESRGLHYNTDYPDISGDMEVTIVQKAKSEDLAFNRLEDIIFEWK
jgi:aspartate oxidase